MTALVGLLLAAWPGLSVLLPAGLAAAWFLPVLATSGAVWLPAARTSGDRPTVLDLLAGAVALYALLSVWLSPGAGAAGTAIGGVLALGAGLAASRAAGVLPAAVRGWSADAFAAAVMAAAVLTVATAAWGRLPVPWSAPAAGEAVAALAVLCWPASVTLARRTGPGALHRLMPAAPPALALAAALLTESWIATAGLLAGALVFALARRSVGVARWLLAGLLMVLAGGALPLASLLGNAPGIDSSGVRPWVTLWESAAQDAVRSPILGYGIDASDSLFPRIAARCRPPVRALAGGFADLPPEEQRAVATALGYLGPLGGGGFSRYLAVQPDAARRFQALQEARRWEVPVEGHPCTLGARTVHGDFASLAADDQYAIARSLGYRGELGRGGLGRHLDAQPGQRALFQAMEAERAWLVHDLHRACTPTARTLSGAFRGLAPPDQRAVARSLGYWGELGGGGFSRHLADRPEERARFAAMEHDQQWKVHDVFCPDGAAAGNPFTPARLAAAAARWSDPQGRSPHLHNAFLHVWLDLGEVGAALLAGLLLAVLTCAHRTPDAGRPAALAQFAAALCVGGFAVAPWNPSWLATLVAGAVALQVAAHPAPGGAARRGAVLVVHFGGMVEFLLLQGVFAAIRQHHRDQRLLLLTDNERVFMGRVGGVFDAVLDATPSGLLATLRLRRRLREVRIGRVYDLRGGRRTARIRRLLASGSGCDWLSVAPEPPSGRRAAGGERLTLIERCRRQLAPLGIAVPALPDVSWLGANVAGVEVGGNSVLLMPESGGPRTARPWGAERYAALARVLVDAGLRPVVAGTAAASGTAQAIRAACPAAIDVTGRVNLPQLASLARAAAVVVGGPSPSLHLAAAVCPAVVLCIGATPAAEPPAGPDVTLVESGDGAACEVADVAATVLGALQRRAGTARNAPEMLGT